MNKNIPYVRQYDDKGVLIDVIGGMPDKKYVNEFPNRRERKKFLRIKAGKKKWAS